MKTLKPVNVRKYNQGKKWLGLTLISVVLGINLLGCSQETPTPEANQTTTTPKPSPTTATPKPSPTTATSQANQTTATPKPTTTAKPTTVTPKPSPTTATPKPSPTTATSTANQGTPTELPKPNAQGFYQRTSHKNWQIVDTSGKGIPCRMGKATIEQIQTPGNSVVLDIANWPVIGTFKQGQTFEIDLGPAGFGILADNKKQPWIYVEKSVDKGAPSKCFVRADSSSVKPVAGK
ncbi:MAG TPA: hypothetical protein VK211_14820 [Kamptonema sp.]|nr:hypothetical protein [Kamptonema sp.]